MLRRLARFTIRRRRLILVASLGFIVLAGAFGGSVAKHLSSGGFNDPSSESSRAADLLQSTFHTSDPNIILLIRTSSGSVTEPSVPAKGRELTARLAREPGMGAVVSYWRLGEPPPLASRDGTEALVLGVLPRAG